MGPGDTVAGPKSKCQNRDDICCPETVWRKCPVDFLFAAFMFFMLFLFVLKSFGSITMMENDLSQQSCTSFVFSESSEWALSTTC